MTGPKRCDNNPGDPALPAAQTLKNLLPVLQWLPAYRRADLPHDLTAGVITAVLLIPQAMAFAALAGLAPAVGLYASILPPLLYALLGSSRTLSVGPVSITALMVASAVGSGASETGHLATVLTLTGLSGALFLLMAVLRLGALVHFISHPVLSGFTSAAAVMIILSQIGALTGIAMPRGIATLELVPALLQHLEMLHAPTLAIGAGTLAALVAGRGPLRRALGAAGLSPLTVTAISRATPLLVLAGATGLAVAGGPAVAGVALVGDIHAGLPPLTFGLLEPGQVTSLLPSAILISLIGYVQSVSVGKAMAHRRRQRLEPNQELLALGVANAGAAFTGGMPVAGGFSRSMVNFDAGARTQLAGVVAAGLVAAAALVLTPLFTHLPRASLAAVIVVAVTSLLDWREALAVWRYDAGEFLALAATFLGVLGLGLEWGLLTGAGVALALELWRSGHPHFAVVGRVPGTEHFRNVRRHQVETWPELVLLRVDESLFFANASLLEDVVGDALARQPSAVGLVLICSAVNRIDYSALETLESMSRELREAGVRLHLAEVKGPVMDRLEATGFRARFPGEIFLSTEQAVEALGGE